MGKNCLTITHCWLTGDIPRKAIQLWAYGGVSEFTCDREGTFYFALLVRHPFNTCVMMHPYCNERLCGSSHWHGASAGV
jgi:hypothetical protein